jgi:hypothetical protein
VVAVVDGVVVVVGFVVVVVLAALTTAVAELLPLRLVVVFLTVVAIV